MIYQRAEIRDSKLFSLAIRKIFLPIFSSIKFLIFRYEKGKNRFPEPHVAPKTFSRNYFSLRVIFNKSKITVKRRKIESTKIRIYRFLLVLIDSSSIILYNREIL